MLSGLLQSATSFAKGFGNLAFNIGQLTRIMKVIPHWTDSNERDRLKH